MAIAHVGNWTSAQFNFASGGTLTGRTSTAGSLVAITSSSSDATVTISHSQAGSVLGAVGPVNNGGDTIRIDYVENIVGGASHTVSMTTNAEQYSVLNASEYSGIATSSSIDQTGSGTGTSTTLSSGNVTTTQADELLVGAGTISAGTDSTFTATSSFTLRGSIGNADEGTVGYLIDRIVSATGTYAATATWGGSSGAWVAAIATFKAAAAGGTTPKGIFGNPFDGPFGGPI